MKLTSLITFLITLLLTNATAYAANEGFFLGASLGQTKYGHTNDLEEFITESDTFKAYNTKVDSTDGDTGNKIYLGYGFNKYFGLEFGMASLGTQEVNVDLSFPTPPIEGSVDATYAWSAQFLEAVLTLPLGVVSPFVKFGTTSVTYKAESKSKVTTEGKTGKDSSSEEEKGTGTVMGAGVEIMLGKGLGLRLESESFTAKDGNDLELVFQLASAGLTYTF